MVDIHRVERAYARFGERFTRRILTDQEWGECGTAPRPALQLALRFAAKEAGMKALGTGWAKGVRWRDFEVVAGPTGPELRLWGRAAEIAAERGSDRVWLSSSWTRTHAIAQVVLERTAVGPVSR